MKISTKGRYGLRALVDLHRHQSDNKPTFLKDVADRQKISRRYLERLFGTLKSFGILRSVRGASGGYLLARDASSITAYDVLLALEGPLVTVDCVSDKELCPMSGKCVTHQLWESLFDQVTSSMKLLTLDKMAKIQSQLEAEQTNMYHI